MAGRRRLKELFQKYDVSGDGVLSEEEMSALFASLGLAKEDSRKMFEAADANKDGMVQINEFLDWLMGQKSTIKCQQDSCGVEFTISNPSDRVDKRYTLTFDKCRNVDFPEGNPAEFLVKAGEQITKRCVKISGSGAWTWHYRWAGRAEFCGVEESPGAFKDPEFPHEASSIGVNSSEYSMSLPDVWVQARSLGDPAEVLLFDKVQAQDVQQGRLGDCWLLSAMWCLAEHPKHIKKLFKTKEITDDGRYEVWLFDIEAMEWKLVVVDEFIPCTTGSGRAVPTYTRPLGEEIWVLLLEKAVAKFCGSYATLSGGGTDWAFQIFTGYTKIVAYWKLDDDASTWRRCFLNREKQLQNGAKNPLNNWYGWKNSDVHPKGSLFGIIQEHLTKGGIASCIISGNSVNQAEVKNSGLYVKHYYSILQVREEEKDDETKIQLILLRNPWGELEWNGPWSDGCDQWNANPKMKGRIHTNRNDGIFWMSIEDWAQLYTKFQLCPLEDVVHLPEEEVSSGAAAGDAAAFL